MSGKISYALGISMIFTVSVLVLEVISSSNSSSSIFIPLASAALTEPQPNLADNNSNNNATNNTQTNNSTQNNSNGANINNTATFSYAQNYNSNHGKTKALFAFVFHKSGGFAPVDITISYNPLTKELSYMLNGNTTNKTLSEQQVSNLTQLFTKSGFFSATENFYPAASGSADYFTYTLIAAYGGKINAVYWTDASSGVPEGLRSLPQILQQIIQGQSQHPQQ